MATTSAHARHFCTVTLQRPLCMHGRISLWIRPDQNIKAIYQFKFLKINNFFNNLAAVLFLLPFAGHGVNFLQTFTWHRLSFSMFTVWHGLFSLVLMFFGLRIEAPPPSTVQGKCI